MASSACKGVSSNALPYVPVVTLEVVGAREEGDAAAGLVADVRQLFWCGRPGQEQGRPASIRRPPPQRLSPPSSGVSSTTEKRSATVKNASASS